MQQILNLGFIPQEITNIKGDINILYQNTYNLLIVNGKMLQEINCYNFTINHQIHYPNFSQSYKPVKVTYSKKYDIYLILFDDWQIYILSTNLNFHTKISVISSYPIAIQFVDDSSSLYIVQDCKVEQIFMDIKRTSLQVKVTFKNKLSFANANKYFIGFSFQYDLLFLWEQYSLKVYNQEYQLISNKENITTQKNSINCLLYYPQLYYVVCGTKSGKIITWTLYNQNQPINIFEIEHGCQVEQIQNDKNNDTQFWTISNNEISLYSITSWSCLQIYKLSLSYKHLYFISQYKLFAVQNNNIILLTRQLEQKQLYQHKSEIRCQIEGTNNPQFLFENNCIIDIENHNKFKALYIKTKQTIIQAHQINQIYYFLTDIGDILKFENDDVQTIIQNNHLQNSEGALVKHKITNILFLQININLIYLFVYIQQGQILVILLPNFQKSITELNSNRCSISTSTILQCSDQNIYILTIDEHNNFQLLKFQNNTIQVIQQMIFKIEIKKMISLNNRIFILTKQGQLHLFKYYKNEFSECLSNGQGEEYSFLDFKVYFQPKIILASQQLILIIMTFKKVLLRQINLETTLLDYGYFTKYLILCLAQEISYVENSKFQFDSQTIKELNYTHNKQKQQKGFEIFSLKYQETNSQIQTQNSNIIQSKKQINTVRITSASRKQTPQVNKRDLYYHQKTLGEISQKDRTKSSNQKVQEKYDPIITQSRPFTQISFQGQLNQSLEQSSSLESYNLPKGRESFYYPAIPNTKQIKPTTLEEQFIENRFKKQKFKTRRDLTMNRIIQRNIRILSFC